MKNKKEEIIINDVNVAECEFLRHCVIPDNEGCKIDDSLCCDVGNCYYKQIKRLQEENEELKKYQYTQEDLQSEIEKRQKALEEIRDIAKEATNSKDCYIYMYAGRMYCEPILKKIDEVLNDR